MRYKNRFEYEKRLEDMKKRMETLKNEYDKMNSELEEFDKWTLLKSVTDSGLSIEAAVKLITENALKQAENSPENTTENTAETVTAAPETVNKKGEDNEEDSSKKV
jgi:hypothetical protein